jgi:plasmid stability protein
MGNGGGGAWVDRPGGTAPFSLNCPSQKDDFRRLLSSLQGQFVMPVGTGSAERHPLVEVCLNPACGRGAFRRARCTAARAIGVAPRAHAFTCPRPEPHSAAKLAFETGLPGDYPAAIDDSSMAQLIVRNLEPEIVRRLRARAARHGRSSEAEHREILRRALGSKPPDRTLGDLILAMPNVGSDAEFTRRREMPRRVRL